MVVLQGVQLLAGVGFWFEVGVVDDDVVGVVGIDGVVGIVGCVGVVWCDGMNVWCFEVV